MSKVISHRELRKRWAEILRRVEAGESFEVTDHGRVVALLAPVDSRLPAGVSPATVQGGFAELPRTTVDEASRKSLDDLRGER